MKFWRGGGVGGYGRLPSVWPTIIQYVNNNNNNFHAYNTDYI